jgi:hypothetical protein
MPVQSRDSSAFERLVLNSRDATAKYRQDTPEADTALQNFLMLKLRDARIVGADGKNTDWNYSVVDPARGECIPVCRYAFIAIYGFSMSKLKYVQRLINNDVAVKFTDADAKAATVKDVFSCFGMDVEFYHQNVANFCDFNAVPESEGAISAVAYLADFFELASEHQPTGKSIISAVSCLLFF